MSRVLPPSSTTRYEEIPVSEKERHDWFVDNFGHWLFWIRNRSLDAARCFVEQELSRQKLGTIRRRPYEAVAAMLPEQREAALKLAKETLDGFLERLLWALGDEGIDSRLDDRHAYRFRIQTEIVDVETGAIIEDKPINRGGSFFGKNWGRWLNRFSESKPNEPKQ
jgi:hypothetical protein